MPQQRVIVKVAKSPQKDVDLGKFPKPHAERIKAKLDAESGATIVGVELGPEEPDA
jgi:hypothetical protein